MSVSKSGLFPSAGSLSPFISSTPAHPMAVTFASTFLCSQEIHGLASVADAHLFRREKSKDDILKALERLGPAGLCETPFYRRKTEAGWGNKTVRTEESGLLWVRGCFPSGLNRPGYSPGQDHRQCQAEQEEAGPHHCPGPGPPSCSLTVSRWLPGPPRGDLGLSPGEAGSYPTGTAVAHTWHLWR